MKPDTTGHKMQDVLQKALRDKDKPDKQVIVEERNAIIVHQVLKKNKGFVLKVYPDGREITRKMNDLIWLQNSLMLEFPFYYVR